MGKKRLDDYQVVIVGAGIVGLATAYQLALENNGLKIAVLEKELDVAAHQTGRNSGVIHSGIYYKPGSLKALNCRQGYDMMLKFLAEHKIPFELCGKLIVALNEKELPALQNLYDRGIANGLDKIQWVEKNDIAKYEPNVNGVKAIWVPYTGIVDYLVVSQKLKQLLQEQFYVDFYFNSKVTDFIERAEDIQIETPQAVFHTKGMINCAGLYSDKLAKKSIPHLDLRIIPFRGEYYLLSSKSGTLVNKLIYPVPDPEFPFLGVHYTKKIDGSIEAGPNAVFAFKREGYSKFSFSWSELFQSLLWRGFQKVMFKHWRMGVAEFYRSYNKYAFTKAIRRLTPSVKKSDLAKGGSGVRAQACLRNGKLADDFLIYETKRIIHVCNAPSPAATASLSIGKHIAALWKNKNI
jgi:L-2-hydroxyglutarate oxidase